ncbi:DNA gyrase subunit A [Leptolinea tardivitalis]|nr:DNA gyrase subunit A [Leptolinea tardivitalis]GAP22371.1 DNA gyrase subunit A [Leptolinea tardivitalis]
MTSQTPENPIPSEEPVNANQTIDIDHEMRTAYLDYAMSVIVARALPDARDGLKPVHRRILYGMLELGNRSNAPYKKSARIVGEVLGKYHPHGDSAVYDSMARMAQDFSMRYPLIDGQGNFGSIDGDAPAAMRYTEARLDPLAEEMLLDIEKNTVDFGDNFDGTLKEPFVLPSRLPNLLLNGSSGIAVGMATNIPPHNLRELSKAISYLIDHYETIDKITPDTLMEFLPGPDFPTGGVIIGNEGIRQAYSTGRGRLVVRGLAHIEEIRGGRFAIVVTEIPYQINKTSLIERIAELVREGRIDSITDLRDESDRRGMSIVIELKRGAEPRKVLNQLFKYTPLQSTFGVQLLALVDGEPRTLSLKRALQIYIEHRRSVITRRSQFELEKARARMHILDGLLIALANLDEVIATIRKSPDADTAKTRLMTRFKLTEIQAQAILDMQLRRLAALEREKIEKEAQEVKNLISYLEDLLANPKKILKVVQDDLKQMSDKYGDERRTRIAHDASEKLEEEDLQADVPVLISITQRGYVKRTQTSQYKTQARGGRGVSGQGMKDEDEIAMLIPARSVNTILFFSDQGKVYSEKAYQFPDANRTDKGIPIQNILSIGADEKITTAVAVPDFDKADYFTMATVNGKIKRVVLSEFSSVRPSGLIAMGLDKGDQLGWVRQTSGNDEIILVTKMGKALRMKETAVRAMGRPASGVAGISLAEGDKVTSMEVVEPDSFLLTLTENGFGKRTAIKNYPTKGRATSGVMTIDEKALPKTGLLVSARIVKEDDEITIMTSGGVMLRLKVKDIASQGRASRGVHIINLTKSQLAVSMARLTQEDLAVGQPQKTK